AGDAQKQRGRSDELPAEGEGKGAKLEGPRLAAEFVWDASTRQHRRKRRLEIRIGEDDPVSGPNAHGEAPVVPEDRGEEGVEADGAVDQERSALHRNHPTDDEEEVALAGALGERERGCGNRAGRPQGGLEDGT